MARDEAEQALIAFERELVELHRRFEQYFLGIDRTPPMSERDDLKRRLQRFRANMGRKSTAIRFRSNSLWQRLTSYDQMWTRTFKQIEEGTYHRDVRKAKRRAKYEQSQAESGDKKTAAEKNVQNKEAARAQGKKSRDDAGLSDAQVKKIYDTYLMARKRTGEGTKISKESLARQLRQRAKSLSEKHACDGVAFKIVIKGGKAMIKAQPKK